MWLTLIPESLFLGKFQGSQGGAGGGVGRLPSPCPQDPSQVRSRHGRASQAAAPLASQRTLTLGWKCLQSPFTAAAKSRCGSPHLRLCPGLVSWLSRSVAPVLGSSLLLPLGCLLKREADIPEEQPEASICVLERCSEGRILLFQGCKGQGPQAAKGGRCLVRTLGCI